MSIEAHYTPLDEIEKTRERLRETFRSERTKPIAFRKAQLLQLAYMVQDNAEYFQEALRKDLGRPTLESNMFDLSVVTSEAQLAYKNIEKWTKPEKAPFDFNFFAFSPKVYKEAKGTVLIICTFNFPLWGLAPLSGAIAAGCAAVIKTHEATPATGKLLGELFPKYLDKDLYSIVNGAAEQSIKLLSLQWDHILYTGGAKVGRIVAAAAANHLTPTTLELGGKCPVIVDVNTDFELAARRILWGRMTNAGQICAAPDYALVVKSAEHKFVEALKIQWENFYGNDARNSESFARIASPAHFARISGLLENTKGEIVLGGETDKATKYIAPTVVRNVDPQDSLMSEEIFGPILPIISVPDVDAALDYVNSQPHPLVLYIFSKDAKLRRYVREHTLSGGFMENDTVMSGGCSVTPFGGVGQSGYGAHKGKYSFDTFTHLRASFNSPRWIDLILGIRYPPYTAKTLKKVNAAVMPPISYPRPGETEGFGWKRWASLALVLGLIAANRQRLISLASN